MEIRTVKELIQETINTILEDDNLPVESLELTREELEFTLLPLLFSLKLAGEKNPYIASFQIGIIMTILFLIEEFGEDLLEELKNGYDREDLPI